VAAHIEDPELRDVVTRWVKLPAALRKGIAAMVRDAAK
jgi:hypothetical protein